MQHKTNTNCSPDSSSESKYESSYEFDHKNRRFELPKPAAKSSSDILRTYSGGLVRNVFRAQMALASLVAISGPKKVSISRAHPFQWPS